MGLLILGGCATREERIARFNAAADAKCRSWGAKPGTPEYIQCRTGIEQTAVMAEQADAADRMVMQQGAARSACQLAGRSW